MKTHSLVVHHWEDVVFENRNQDYGAYLLRKTYVQRLLIGLGITITLVAALILFPDYEGDIKPRIPGPKGRMTDGLMSEPVIERERPKRDKLPRKKHSNNRQISVTRELVTDSIKTDESYQVSYEGFDDFTIGSLDGTGTASQVELPAVVLQKFVDFAEVMPAYDGGMEAMMKFIQKKIRFPRGPKSIGIDGTVYVRFLVNGDGSVSDLEVIKGVHPDYDKEAMRVIAMLPSWKGGRHNGLPVSVRMVLPIKFNLNH